ncbi:MAG: DUF5808 domain-containing protein [Bdellovibrionales bacterium]
MIQTVLGPLIILNSVVLVLFTFYMGSQSQPLPPGYVPPSKEEMRKFILWKSFYVNPEDPRGWVPKTWGYGTTVNFRTRGNALAFAGLILLTFVTAIALVVVTLGG